MATADERLKILKLIQKGAITAEEGAQLIEALGDATATRERHSMPPVPPSATRAGGGRWFRVRITDTNSGKTRVNVRMPMSVVNAGLKMGARFAPEIEGLSADQLSQIINSGELGQIVDVYDDEDGEHIEVFIE